MLITLLLILVTLFCLLLRADRTWDDVTAPERNDLVFAGREHRYGAFVLRREYDRRLLLAFLGATALFAAAIAVPKALSAFGLWSAPPHVPVPPIPDERIIDWFTTPEDKPEPPQRPQERHTAAGPATSEGPEIVIVPKDSTTTPEPKDTVQATSPGPTDPGPTGPSGPTLTGSTGQVTDGIGNGMEFTLDKPGDPGIVDMQPEFPGGQEALSRFIQNNLVVHDESITSAHTKVIFVVDTNGTVVRVRTHGRAAQRFNEAAERVVRLMPKWKPARYKDRPVPCVMVLPIDYRTGW